MNSLTARPGRMARIAIVLGLLAGGAHLGGCASTVADLPLVGLPADAPARKQQADAYLPVHDLPADRTIAKLDAAERAKLKGELVTKRDQQNAAGAAAR